MENKSTTTRMKRPKDSECKRLVIRALQSGPTTGMKLTDIYDFVERNSTSTSTTPKKKWQRNVRFILSHYSFFVRSPDRKRWIFNEEQHQRKAEGKRRKIKGKRRNPANQPDSYTAAQQQQYPALASAMDISNPGIHIRPSQSHESATPCYPRANSNQTYYPVLPSCSYVSRFSPCSFSAPPSISDLPSCSYVSKFSPCSFSALPSISDLPSCSYVSKFSPCSFSVPPSISDLPSCSYVSKFSPCSFSALPSISDLPSCSYVSKFSPCTFSAPPSISDLPSCSYVSRFSPGSFPAPPYISDLPSCSYVSRFSS